MKGFKRVGITILLILKLSGCATTGDGSQVHSDTLDQQIQQAFYHGDLVRAESLLRQALSTRPRDAVYWRMLGQVMLRMNNPKAAEYAFERSLQEDQESVLAWHQLGVSYLRLATQAFIEVEVRQERADELPILQWLLELQTGQSQ